MKAINKCPYCGGSVSVEANVKVVMTLDGHANTYLESDIGTILDRVDEQIDAKAYKAYCDECGRHLEVINELPYSVNYLVRSCEGADKDDHGDKEGTD